MIVYRASDRIPVKIGPLKFELSPLTSDQKAQVLSIDITEGGVTKQDQVKQAKLAIKYCVKSVSGIELADGKPFKIKLGEDGCITDDDLEVLLSIDYAPQLVKICGIWAIDRVREVEADGVEFDFGSVKTSKKK